MEVYSFSQLSEECLTTLVTLDEKIGVSGEWARMQEVALTSRELAQLDYLKSTLRERQLVLMNEGTLWARAIYPLLTLAERDYIQAWTGVPLKATYPTFQLEGEADGALAPSVGGKIRPPYFIVHEAKRGITAPNPQYQLFGEMLAAAWLNWKTDANAEQEIFGCYTVTDNWAFVKGVVTDMETEKPTFSVEFSPVYDEVSDAERILQTLKAIVAKRYGTECSE